MKEKNVFLFAPVEETIHTGEDIIESGTSALEESDDPDDDFDDDLDGFYDNFADEDEDELYDEEWDFSDNYIVLTSNIEQLEAIAHAAELLRADDEDDDFFGEVIAVLCGKTVAEIVYADKLLEKTRAADVNVKVCGFSVEKNSVNPDDIPADVEIVKNGIWYCMEKQKEGYLSLGL
ncbi:MAG: hypothetical protein Q4G48_01390 [Bacteroidia bacterium]|nr:hypothetical protein [Bacteroidia bacterium]